MHIFKFLKKRSYSWKEVEEGPLLLLLEANESFHISNFHIFNSEA